MHYNHGTEADIHHSCHPHQGRWKYYRGSDDEQRLWSCTPEQEVMRLRRWKMKGRGSQAMFSWIGYYTREEEGQYLRRQNFHWLSNTDWTLASSGTKLCLLLSLGKTTFRHDFLPCIWLLKISRVWGGGSIKMSQQATTSKKWLLTPGKVQRILVLYPS